MFIVEKLEDRRWLKVINTFSPFYKATVKMLLYILLEYVIYKPIDNISILILSITIIYNILFIIYYIIEYRL